MAIHRPPSPARPVAASSEHTPDPAPETTRPFLPVPDDATATTRPARAVYPGDESRRRTTTALVAFAHGLPADRPARQLVLTSVVRLNTGVAEAVAARYRRRGVDGDDLTQAAYEGLVKAVGRFDPTKAEDLLSFAVPTIRGEVQRHFRDRSWSVRPPRALQELEARARKESDHLLQLLGREATLEELADALGVTVAECAQALTVRHAWSALSLDKPLDGADGEAGPTLGGRLSEDAGFGRIDDLLSLRPALATLGERDRLVVQLRFVEELTQGEIAQRLGITQTHVSRLLHRILRRLRDQLDGPAPTPVPGHRVVPSSAA